ncbi:MAG TPA: hypothetical protein VGP55_13210 [Chitinophagaceae bacterium]|nr:hypothetical protein [Chitinophagaceae bacterium]
MKQKINKFRYWAFVTSGEQTNLTEDDKELAKYLTERGIAISPAVWDDSIINWNQYDAIILRSTWDYFLKPIEFDNWLDKLESLNCKVLNPVSVVKWNKSKKYFTEFSEKGILIPTYKFCVRGTDKNLGFILQENNWNKAVVKPAISCGSYNTWIATESISKYDELRFSDMLQEGDVIVQQFINEIITDGELSLIYFNKQFSHAIRKRAAENDFRVQPKFGGKITIEQPDENILKIATEILNEIKEPLLYARVDGIVTNNGKFSLMELELIEPILFVKGNQKACENFYNAAIQLIY